MNELKRRNRPLMVSIPNLPTIEETEASLQCTAPVNSPNMLSPQQIASEPPKIQICLDDIYHTIEKERYRSRRKLRGRNISSAHTQVLTHRSENGARVPGLDTFSLPPLSRPTTGGSSVPQTARSGSGSGTRAPQTEADLLIDYHSSPERMAESLQYPAAERSLTTLSAPLVSMRSCIRSRSAVDREMDGLVNSLSRQCCDVMGSAVCHQCAVIKRRDKDTIRYESTLPNLHISEANFATTFLISKACPHLPPTDIYSKLARGDILRPAFRYNVERMKTWKAENEKQKLLRAKNTTGISHKTTYTFFTNIKHLNEKITSGEVVRKLRSGNNPEEDKPSAKEERPQIPQTFSEMLCPKFISPKNIKPDKQLYVSYYEPPLLSKKHQNVEPAFFAGSATPYKLPDRLPDNYGHVNMADDNSSSA